MEASIAASSPVWDWWQHDPFPPPGRSVGPYPRVSEPRGREIAVAAFDEGVTGRHPVMLEGREIYLSLAMLDGIHACG